jgi:GNAT superfamily N-acetyltransferase
MSEVRILPYSTAYHKQLLELLLKLHNEHFNDTVSWAFQELQREKDQHRSYDEYITSYLDSGDASWRAWLAIDEQAKIVGYIIGSVSEDDSLVLGKIGTIEDWLVEKSMRGNGIGMKLYAVLENWFREKGCRQLRSETWQGNISSIHAHQKAGFFISEVKFSKKL